MNKTYLTILSSDEFLPGILVLNQSLRESGSTIPLHVLVTDRISDQALSFLKEEEISYKVVPHLRNPHSHYRFKSFRNNFNMLHVFNQHEYDKLVFLDADMLVCGNLDSLFSQPHGAAVNAGGMLPECSDWNNFNGGLIVIEPSEELFEDMIAKSKHMPSHNGGVQGFLHAYYADWPNKPSLHLDHGYNLYVGHWGPYHDLFGYDVAQEGHAPKNEVKVLHFWGPCKPWVMEGGDALDGKYGEAFRLWNQQLNLLLERLPAEKGQYLMDNLIFRQEAAPSRQFRPQWQRWISQFRPSRLIAGIFSKKSYA